MAKKGNLSKPNSAQESIDSLRTAFEALQKEHEFLQRYVTLVEAIIIILDSEGIIKMINRKGCEILGYKEKEILGKNWFKTCLPQPLGRKEVYPVFQSVMAGKLSVAEYYENEVLTKDGQTRLISWHNNFFRDENGKINGTISSGQDITEKQIAENALKESEERYRNLFDNNHTIMLVIDPETGNIVDANPSAVSFYGWEKSKLTAKKITDINMLSKEEVFKEMERAKREKRRHFLFKHRLKNKKIRDVEVFSGPIIINGKKLLFSIIHDVTKRLQIEAERNQLIDKLEKALSEIKTLRGLIPVCAWCKDIRDDDGYWQSIDDYLTSHSNVKITHGICPECSKRVQPEAQSN